MAISMFKKIQIIVGLTLAFQVLPARCTSSLPLPASVNDNHTICTHKLSVEATICELEQRVEQAIVNGDTQFLQSIYSDDFRFSHSSGEVTDKAESLRQVAERTYVMRRLDAINIETHGHIIITYGLVDMNARGDHGNRSYLVKYIRTYEKIHGHWKMLMQRSIDVSSSLPFDLTK
jgi:hypothetical protein